LPQRQPGLAAVGLQAGGCRRQILDGSTYATQRNPVLGDENLARRV